MSAAESWTPYEIGTRVRLRHDEERWPHFIAPAGSVGTVSYSDADVYAVKLDDPPEGSEDWDGEVHWYPSNDYPPTSEDLESQCGYCSGWTASVTRCDSCGVEP